MRPLRLLLALAVVLGYGSELHHACHRHALRRAAWAAAHPADDGPCRDHRW